MREAAALLHLSRRLFTKHLLGRKALLLGAITAGCGVLVATVGMSRGWNETSFAEIVGLRLLGLFVVPTVSLVAGVAAIGDERESGILVHLLARPLHRTGVALSAWGAVVPVALGWTLGTLGLCAWAASTFGRGEGVSAAVLFDVMLEPVLWSTLAYVSVFFLLGVSFRHAMVIGLAWVFFVEVFMGRAPGVLKRVSVAFYAWSMVYSGDQGVEVTEYPRDIFLPIAVDSARIGLWCFAGGALLLALVVFSRREYRDLG